MKVSSQEEYGLRCLVRVAALGADAPVSLTAIAIREGISREYAAKLLRVLRQGDLVVSVRGAGGGYQLARPAHEITVHDAVVVLDGPIYDAGFCGTHTGQEDACVNGSSCGIRGLWSWIGATLEGALEGVTLADLVRGETVVGDALPPTPSSPTPFVKEAPL